MKSLLFPESAFFSLAARTIECQWAEITQLNVTGFTIASFNSIGLRLFFSVMFKREQNKCSRPRPNPQAQAKPSGQHLCVVAGGGQNFVFEPWPKF